MLYVNKLFLIISFPVVVWASDSNTDALDNLKKMYSAAQTLDYHGTFVYLHDGNIESIQIFHSVTKDGEHERLFHLNGSPREIIRDKNIVTCILPDNKSVLVNSRQSGRPLFLSLPANFQNLKQYYTFTLAGKDRIAGQTAHIILIGPTDNFRYGYRLWVAESNSLLLKSELLNEHKQPIEQIMFTQLEVVDHIPDAMLKPTINGEEFTWHRETHEFEENSDAKTEWKVTKLPKGFQQTEHHNRYFISDNKAVEHMLFSDGLASVSVYIEKLEPKAKKFEGLSSMGAVNVYGSVIGTYQITVIGEVPKDTVKMVADSVESISE